MKDRTKLLILLVGIAILVFALFQAREAYVLRKELGKLQLKQIPLATEVSRLQSESLNLSNRLAGAGKQSAMASERLRELLRLRSEVGSLRREIRDGRRTGVGSSYSKMDADFDPTPSRQAIQPAPFQLQLVLDAPGQDSETVTNSLGRTVGETVEVAKTPLLDSTAVSAAYVSNDPVTGLPQVEIQLNKVGQELFAAVTRENIDKRLAIVANGQLYAAPVVRSEITGGKVQITGNFSNESARDLADRINAGIGK